MVISPPPQADAAPDQQEAAPGAQPAQEEAVRELEGAQQGLPLNDASLARAVRRVVVFAAIGATFYICTFIWRLMIGMYGESEGNRVSDSLWSGFSQLIIELSIPACGYYGALYAHRTLIFFFCGANLIFVVTSTVNFFRLVLRMGTGDSCEQTGDQYSGEHSDCPVMAQGVERYLLPLNMALLVCFGCFSFGAGKRLYQGLGPFDAGRLAPSLVPVLGEVVTLPLMASSGDQHQQLQQPQPAVVVRVDAGPTVAGGNGGRPPPSAGDAPVPA